MLNQFVAKGKRAAPAAVGCADAPGKVGAGARLSCVFPAEDAVSRLPFGLRLADVILDSLHFSGGATTFDAFAMGTPVVALPVKFMRGRQTLSCYRRLGMDECVARDAGDYVAKAANIAENPRFRETLSACMMAASALLFEDDGMIRELEELLSEVV